MSQRTSPRRVVLADFKAAKELEGAIDIETPDGQVFRIPPPALISDELLARSRTAADDPIGFVTALLGADAYEKFKAAGGSAAVALAIFQEEQGADVGESSASSSS